MEIRWTPDLDFYVNCNDLFFWGCSDAEDIETQEDIDLLKKCFEDIGEYWATQLFTARKRRMRPQGAAYPKNENLWKFFDDCGPEREIDLCNPNPHPEVKKK
jgi:hypothetical protein